MRPRTTTPAIRIILISFKVLERVQNSLPKSDKLLQSPEYRVAVWNADRQRAELKGFARLKAILWRRSLSLYQGYQLAGCVWYAPLQRALREVTGRLDLLSTKRVRRAADIFGETPILTTVRLLEMVETLCGARPSLFVDLGCGRGVTCLTASSLGIPSLGLEQEALWVRAASEVAARLGLSASFREGDFLETEWPAQATFLIVGTAYPEEMRQEIALRLQALGPGISVITGDWSLPSDAFKPLWEGSLPVDWGVARFGLWTPISTAS